MLVDWGVSIRRACQALRFDPSSYHYKSRRTGQAGLEHPTIGAGEAKCHEIGVHLLQCSALLARLPGRGLQPAGQLLGKGASLLGRSGVAKPGAIVPAARCWVSVFRDGPVRRAISRIDSFCRKCIRPIIFKIPCGSLRCPRRSPLRGKVHMAQFSMKITRPTASVRDENQRI